MFFEIIVVLVLLALGGWWVYDRRQSAVSRATEDDDTGRHDHAQAHERAKAAAELQRWSGPH